MGHPKLWGCLAASLLIGISILSWFLLFNSGRDVPPNLTRRTRFLGDSISNEIWHPLDMGHPLTANMWYTYAYATAKSYGNDNCYICSLMPHNSRQPTLFAEPMDHTESHCFTEISTVGGLADYIIENHYDSIHNSTCFSMFPRFNYTFANGTPYPFQVYISPNITHYRCFTSIRPGDSSAYLGKLKRCRTIQKLRRNDKGIYGDLYNGSRPTGGGMWLCGTHAYLHLPKNWTGVCAPIHVSDHTFMVSLDDAHKTRGKRATSFVNPTFAPHDSIWGSDVPQEFKLWSTGNKISNSLFPWVGVAKVMLRVETLNYRFASFMNISLNIFEGYNTEIDAMRTMLLQHQTVLDLLTASQGGVCVLFNQTCCTYVPDSIHDSIEPQMQALCSLQSAMTQDRIVQSPFDWFFSGAWWQTLVRLLMLSGAVLVLIGVFFCCCVPCIRALLDRLVRTTISPVDRNLVMMPLFSPDSVDSDFDLRDSTI